MAHFLPYFVFSIIFCIYTFCNCRQTTHSYRNDSGGADCYQEKETKFIAFRLRRDSRTLTFMNWGENVINSFFVWILLVLGLAEWVITTWNSFWTFVDFLTHKKFYSRHFRVLKIFRNFKLHSLDFDLGSSLLLCSYYIFLLFGQHWA